MIALTKHITFTKVICDKNLWWSFIDPIFSPLAVGQRTIAITLRPMSAVYHAQNELYFYMDIDMFVKTPSQEMDLRSKQNIYVFPVTRPYLGKSGRPKTFYGLW